MTRLEKYLLTTASDIIEAETTMSRYFIIGNIKVRVSDHFANNSDADLQIIVPYNGGTKYLVTVLNSPGKFVSWNAKQIQEFIPMLQIMKGLKSSIKAPDKKELIIPVSKKIQMAMEGEPSEKAVLEFHGLITSKLKEINLGSVQRSILRKGKSTWTYQEISAVSTMIGKDLGRKSVSVNEDVQIFLTCTSVNYNEILNIYKTIIVDNNRVPTISLLQEALSLIRS